MQQDLPPILAHSQLQSSVLFVEKFDLCRISAVGAACMRYTGRTYGAFTRLNYYFLQTGHSFGAIESLAGGGSDDLHS